MATAVKVSIEEYLTTSYHPDVEYIDGELKEKPVVQFAHGRVQVLLGVWFWQHEEEWHIVAAAETRTQVNANHVRLPDLVVISSATKERDTLKQPPLIAIEVLSPTDTYQDLKSRAIDLEEMGVKNIWLIDEEARTAEIWRQGSWYLSKAETLHAVDMPLYLNLSWLWQQMDKHL